METCNRFIKRLMLLLAGWGAGGVFAFSQSLPAPVPEETVYFPLKDIRLLDSPFRSSTKGERVSSLVKS